MIDLTKSPEKIKAAILQDAMQGKLTKQLPEDGNASELLKQIEATKNSLIAEGKIKRQKKLPDIDDDEIPFEIPDNWKWVKLRDLTYYIQRGKSPKYGNDGIKVLSQKCVRWGDIDISKARTITKESMSNYESIRFLKPNDILWNSTGKGTLGRVSIIKDNLLGYDSKMVVDSHVTVIRTLICSNNFIIYYLSSPQVQFNLDNLSSGSTKQTELSKKSIENLLIPLPPLAEQKRIAAKLDEILPKLDKLNKYVNQIHVLRTDFPKKLRASFLQAAMQGKLTKQLPEDGDTSDLLKQIEATKDSLIAAGKIKKQKPLPDISDDEIPFKIPNNWKWVRLGTISNLIIGKTPSRHNADYWNGNVPWVSVRDINNEILNSTNEGITDIAALEKFQNKIVPKETMLMSFKLSIGKVCILGTPAYHNEAIVSFYFYEFKDVLQKYLFKTIKFLTMFAPILNIGTDKPIRFMA